MKTKWEIEASEMSVRTSNPIREVVDGMKIEPNKSKELISLSIGDPTIFDNFKVHVSIEDSIINNIKSGEFNGYALSHGSLKAREAIAEKFTTNEAPLTSEDVIICSGCSGALDIIFSVLLKKGSNILLPRPGFSLYRTLMDSKGFQCRYYDLLPNKNWEVDIKQLETLVDNNTVAILINNPSNPCGSVYSKNHLKEIIEFCKRFYVPIIADEIYSDMVFSTSQFYPLATISKEVPILTVGGLAKKYLVPGWRVGWIMIHDYNGYLKELRPRLISLTQIIIGANTLIQSSIPNILHNTPQEFHDNNNRLLEENANISIKSISQIKGLKPIKPQGAMYMMVGVEIDQFKDIKDDVMFTEKLMEEESVFCLPGKCFGLDNFFRIVITPPPDKLIEAYKRLDVFCKNNSK